MTIAPERIDASWGSATAETCSCPRSQAASSKPRPVVEPASARGERHREAIGAIPGAERFEILEAIASGGQGTVFRAYDRQSRQQLALKVFHRTSAKSHQSLKEEFRSLSRLSHPGIVRLHELHVGEEHGFFTMELLDGVDIKTYFERSTSSNGSAARPGPNWHAVRLAFIQLALAIAATHEAGLLHLDIKPRNISVTTTGRVVLLDFGLVRRARRASSAQLSPGGTPGFMAPEQRASAAVSEKTDWYAFGAVLHVVLTGGLPSLDLNAEGSVVRLRSGLALPAVPADLAALCFDLLAHDPARRPTGKETLARLLASSPQHVHGQSGLLVGRQRELLGLESALAALSSDSSSPVSTVVVRISGPAGIGKTTLVEHFLVALESANRARSFSGRCFEHAMIRYRLLDELMDRLAEELRGAGRNADVSTARLGQLFPTFRSKSQSALAPPAPEDARHFVAEAVRELLGVLRELTAPGSPIVLWLDDVQWSDQDSIPLLLELLTRNTLPLMVILTSRTEEDPPRLVRGLEDLTRASSHLVCQSMSLQELCPSEVDQLVQHLAPAELGSNHPARSHASGNPLEIVELMRHVSVAPEPELHAAPGMPPVSSEPEEAEMSGRLNRLYIGRVARLEPHARRYLELVSLADQPVSCDLLRGVVGADRDETRALQSLAQAALIRVEGGRAEPAHHTIRSCVSDYLLPDQRRDTHRALAGAYLAHDAENDEVLAYHLERAGDISECIVHLRKGAEAASAALAFTRAGSLYERAHELMGSADRVARDELDRERKRAEAMLTSIQHGPIPNDEANRVPEMLARRAIECHMLSGHFEQAEPRLRQLLGQVGLPVFESELAALRRCLWELVRLLWRGLPEVRAVPSQTRARDHLKLEVCESALRGYSTQATFRGAVYGLLYLSLARKTAEPRRLVLGIVHVACFLTFANFGWSRRFGRSLLARGALVAGDDPELRALLHATSGVQDLFTGAWRTAFEKLALPRQDGWSSGAFGPEWNLSGQLSLIALDQLGRMDVMSRQARDTLDIGRTTGNIMVEGESRAWCALAELAAGNLEAVEHHLQLGASDAPQLAFLFVHWSLLRVRTLAYLYAGNLRSALQCWNESRAGLRRSGLLTIQFVRIAAHALEAQVIAGEAAIGGLPRERALRTLRRIERRLAREDTPYGLATRHVVRANASLLRGARGDAIRALVAASELYARADMQLYARSAELCALHLGHPLGDRNEIEAAARRMGVAEPMRWALSLVPGHALPGACDG